LRLGFHVSRRRARVRPVRRGLLRRLAAVFAGLGLAAFFLAALVAQPALAGRAEGIAAYQAGDHAAALRELAPVAQSCAAEAQAILGFIYFAGTGVPHSNPMALRWYGLAAARGHTGAKFNLGFMYTEGRMVDQDDVEAQKWFNLAAAAGDARARQTQTFLAQRMTQEKMTDAQARARAWLDEFGRRQGSKRRPVATRDPT